jgi:galactokinase
MFFTLYYFTIIISEEKPVLHNSSKSCEEPVSGTIRELKQLKDLFQERYGRKPAFFYAPGRVNLIGEHTDYNEGFVLPMAIDQGTTVAVAERSDGILNVWSMNLKDSCELDLNNLSDGRSGSWKDYIEGIAAALISRGVRIPGADIALKSDVSLGGGLSSSAALEMSLGKALLSISGARMEGLNLALAGQTAEHSHVGINSGIMDQYTSIHAKQDHALLLDCRSLKSTHVPLKLENYRIVICNSLVRHSLASSEYNQRRNDCERATELLRMVLPKIRSLRDVSISDFEANKSLLPDTIARRCRHVISENERTLKAAELLSTGDIRAMGELMFASHQSLRDDYEVSCHELDWLVESATAYSGVLGARMTGGGFGGCTVNIVDNTKIDSFRETVSREYYTRTNLIPEIFVVRACEGARQIYAQ